MTAERVTVADDGPWLRAVVDLPGCPPERALAAFTDPTLVAGWWHGELRTTLAENGPYLVHFPALDQTMTGSVRRYDPPERLEFSWGWAHQPEDPPRRVLVETGPGTLAIRHGPYSDDGAGRAARAEHREGWEFFLPRLAKLLTQGG